MDQSRREGNNEDKEGEIGHGDGCRRGHGFPEKPENGKEAEGEHGGDGGNDKAQRQVLADQVPAAHKGAEMWREGKQMAKDPAKRRLMRQNRFMSSMAPYGRAKRMEV